MTYVAPKDRWSGNCYQMLLLALSLVVNLGILSSLSAQGIRANATQAENPTIAPEEFQKLIGSQTAFAEAPVFGQPSDVSTVSHNAFPNVDPVSIQLAELQSQLSNQSSEIAQLRGQLQSPLRVTGRKTPKYFATYESVLVQPVNSNPSALIVETDSGFAQVLFPWKLEHSPRVEFGVMPAEGKLGYRMRYWQFNHGESFSGDTSAGGLFEDFDGFVGFLSEDGDITAGLAAIDSGEFSSNVRTDVIDWEVQRSISTPIDVFAGIRYGRIKQGYLANTGADFALAETEFRGVGPSLGMRFTHTLPLDRLSLFADARGSLLFGSHDFNFYDSANDLRHSLNSKSVDEWSDTVNAMSTNAELKLGVQYVPTSWLAMRVALEVQHFGGVGSPNPSAALLGPDQGISGSGPLQNDLGFYGLSVGLEAGF